MSLARSIGGVEQQFAVRTDRIRILPPGAAPADANSLAGQVRLVEYQGPMVHLRLASPEWTSSRVAVTEQAYFAAPFGEGDTVTAAWNDDDMHPLAA